MRAIFDKYGELETLSLVVDPYTKASRYVALLSEYDIASLYLVSFYCFVTKACARRPGAAASVELAGATRARQARPSSAYTFSADHK